MNKQMIKEIVIDLTLEELANEIEQLIGNGNFELVYDERYNSIIMYSNFENVEKVAKALDRDVFFNEYDGYFVYVKDFHEMNGIFEMNGLGMVGE